MTNYNEQIEAFYRTYMKQNPQAPQTYTAWSFGGDDALADKLAELVVQGVKTATSSNHLLYELENEPVPEPGLHSIVLDRAGNPRAVIEIIEVEVKPYKEVDETFAFKEGEGDRTLAYWRSVHEPFFSKEMKEIGRDFSSDMLVVCEEFAVRFIAHK
ncbi:ASCH domain-containing protein [Terribacillus saccharophilus]|uniref:ASCH domain-containing protein n=1 Tax=Terribacillus saccharophilus TaxID=361277 RepID=UPI003D361587